VEFKKIEDGKLEERVGDWHFSAQLHRLKAIDEIQKSRSIESYLQFLSDFDFKVTSCEIFDSDMNIF